MIHIKPCITCVVRCGGKLQCRKLKTWQKLLHEVVPDKLLKVVRRKI